MKLSKLTRMSGRVRADASLLLALTVTSLWLGLVCAASDEQQPARVWLRPQRATRAQQQSANQSAITSGTAHQIELAPPVAANNRSTRTADVFQNGDGYNIFVTNTCERESMKVNIKTSRPFSGIIHTRNQRLKPICSVEGNGETEYNLEISHVLNSADPNYCGVIRARRESPEDKDVLSVVVAVRFRREIELPDDKFFLLNCTNRCRRRNDCSPPTVAKEIEPDATVTNESPNGRKNDRSSRLESGTTNNLPEGREEEQEQCTIWRFPWAVALLWCLGLLLLFMMILQCITCSSLVCRCVKTEVEEKEPSEYEGATDCEDNLYDKRHPFRIDYDNKDIYKTSNNYAPYSLEDAQSKSRQKKRSAR